MADEKTVEPFPLAKEYHWPKLALGEEYPVTDEDGYILRHEKLKPQEYCENNEDLI